MSDNKMEIQKLRTWYRTVWSEYVTQFTEKHNLLTDCVNGEDIVDFNGGGYFVSFDDIRYSINESVPASTFFEWQQAKFDCDTQINFRSWHLGARPEIINQDAEMWQHTNWEIGAFYQCVAKDNFVRVAAIEVGAIYPLHCEIYNVNRNSFYEGKFRLDGRYNEHTKSALDLVKRIERPNRV